jgi:hypothetical protein
MAARTGEWIRFGRPMPERRTSKPFRWGRRLLLEPELESAAAL